MTPVSQDTVVGGRKQPAEDVGGCLESKFHLAEWMALVNEVNRFGTLPQ